MNFAASPPSRLLRTLAGLARALLWLVAGAWLVFALAWGALHGLIVPRIGEWRPQIESLAARTLGLPVELGGVQAESGSAIPTLTLTDVRLRDPSGREALHLPRVMVALSPRSLWRLGFEQVVVDGATLDVRRDTQGRITVAGIAIDTPDTEAPSRLADWFFSQREFAVRQTTLRWTDEQRPAAGPLELRDVDLVVRNPGLQHQFRLDASPPPGWGERFSVRGLLRQPLLQRHPGRWQSWQGALYAELPRLDLGAARHQVDLPGLLGVQDLEGTGGLRLWAELQRGRVLAITADVALAHAGLRLRQDLDALALHDLGGRIEWQQRGPRVEIGTQGLAFRTADGQAWPGGDLHLGQTLGPAGERLALDLRGQRLDLSALRQLASRLPLEASARDWLERLQPAGLVERIAVDWTLAQAGQPARWKAEGQVRGLALRSETSPSVLQDGGETPGRPGLAGANLDFEATEAGGQARLELDRGQLEFPGVFDEPRMEFQQFLAEWQWKIQGERIEVRVPQLRFANADLQGQAQGSWRSADPGTSTSKSRFPGVLDLQASLQRADGARVHRYLPREVSAEARRYVREAVVRGRASDVQFRVRGDLWDFPFERAGSGEFSVRAKLAGVELAYVPAHLRAPGEAAWPALEKVDAELRIDRASLRIANARAQVVGQPQLQASPVEARIDNFMHGARLQVDARIRGPATEALAFVNRSPLGDLTGRALREARASGPAQVQFQLALPLDQPESATVEGQVQLAGNDLQFSPETPWLRGTNGVLRFSDKGFSVASARARLLGGELQFQGGMARVGQQQVLQFRGQGSVTTDGMRTAGAGDAYAALGALTSGGTAYQAQLEIGAQGLSLAVSSNLQGLAVNLPAPLGKVATAVLPLRIEWRPLPGAEGSARQGLGIDLGATSAPVASARYELDDTPGGTRVLRGALALGAERPALPARGVQARVDLGDFDLEPWLAVFPGPGTDKTAAPATAGAQDPRQFWPTAFSVRARQISHDGRRFHDVRIEGHREQDNWRGNVEAREFKGYVEYLPASADSAGRVLARLDRLALPASAAAEVENLLEQAPARMPALDITVTDFELGPRKLGRLEVEATNRVASGPAREATREWRLNKLNLTVPEARMVASGNWTPLGASSGRGTGVRRTALKLQLEVGDSGALLARLGMPGVLRGGKGRLEGTVGWLGSPLALHYPSLAGELTLSVERGQFLKADPGLAKLLGVLSLQALPRRLTLDFRDVFSEGFAFDFVRGNAKLEQGVISSNNLQMKGVNAAVLLEGSADLARETQDIRVVVVPEINAGTAALIATMINPVTGLGTFLAQYLIGKPIQAAATQQFHISGPWSDPKVEKISRTAVNLEDKKEESAP
jgi:uncharacterized protein (TIGR02099 family)